MEGHRFPAVMPDCPVTHHLIILRITRGRSVGVGEGRGKAGSFQRLLPDPVHDRGRRDVQHVEDGGGDVDYVAKLAANRSALFDYLWVVDNQRIARSSEMDGLLVVFERGVTKL